MDSDLDYAKLARAHEWSRRQLESFRDQRAKIYKLLAGNRYGGGADKTVPVPYLKLLHSVLQRSLLASNPRCMISTRVPELRPLARAMEIAVNHRIKQTRLTQTLRSVISDALVSIGILKVGVCYYPIEGTTGLIHDYMQTYVDSISLDDWVMDMTAKKWDQIGYAGHRIRMARRMLLQDPRLDPAKINELPRATHYLYDEHGNPQTHSLSTRDSLSEGEYDEMVDLWEMWLPRENTVGLYAAGPDGRLLAQAPIWQQEYYGPELGPFHLLRFGELQDNIMPAPPIMDMADMHIGINGVYRKMLFRALNQKNIIPVIGGNTDDVKRINDTPDGHAVRVDGQVPGEMSYGADNQMNIAMVARLQMDGSYYPGNLESIAGLGPQSETASQDKMLHSAASKNIQAMQEQVVEFTRDVMHDLAYYWWAEPQIYQVDVPIEGFPGESIHEELTPEMREGNWLHLNFDIDPFSLQSETPASRMQFLTNFLTQVVGPAYPQLQQQQIAPDWQEILREYARMGNYPNLETIFKFLTPSPEQELSEPPRSPMATSRTYNRVSSSQASTTGRNNAQMQTAMGGASPQQAAVAAGGSS